MMELELASGVLKVVKPYKGSAFMAAPRRAVSCVHVCVPTGESKASEHTVVFEYWAEGAKYRFRVLTCHRNPIRTTTSP